MSWAVRSQVYGSKVASSPFEYLLAPLQGSDTRFQYISLERAEALGICASHRLPRTLKILCEGTLRHADDIEALSISGLVNRPRRGQLEFQPIRLLLQDFTGTPLMTDLASLRDAVAQQGKDPSRVNPKLPIEFVCDHALIAEYGGRADAIILNERIEIERNRERFEFLKWCAKSFSNVRMIPPGGGIMHQLNLEWLSTVVCLEKVGKWALVRPDTLLGTDSHTPMVGGLGVLGWGVGGIEAQSAMLGHSTILAAPRIVGLRLSGVLPRASTATDLVLHIAEFLRKAEVVNAFIEVFGDAFSALSIECRATIANMAPEYGATSVYFPIDHETLRYLRLTGRDDDAIARVEAYAKAQGLWNTGSNLDDDVYDSVLEFDLSTVEPSLAGPKRPEERTPLSKLPASFRKTFDISSKATSAATLKPGGVVIAAITSCTNTSNPSVMLGAGLLARNAVQRGLKVKPWVKTSLAPGSRVVGDYLSDLGLQPYLDALGFQIIGYGCTTCNGNSGALAQEIAQQITSNQIPVAAVLSGNRNFAGRIHPLVRAAYLASPALVIAFAIAGTVLTDLSHELLGIGEDGKPVTLADIWPNDSEITSLASLISADSYRRIYRKSLPGHTGWNGIAAPEGIQFPWASGSTFVTPSPLNMPSIFDTYGDSIDNIRALAIFGDGITTDMLSPNGAILSGSPAAFFLTERGVTNTSFGNYAARRGSHEIALRGMFCNAHIENEMLPGTRGPYTLLLPESEQRTIFEAGITYMKRGTPAMIIAGHGYGSGSSRDWAAKGLRYLGVCAVLAESFERIHRANLVSVGILPLTFLPGANRKTLRLTGHERFRLSGLECISKSSALKLHIDRENNRTDTISVGLNLETENEISILRAGGMLQILLHEFTQTN